MNRSQEVSADKFFSLFHDNHLMSPSHPKFQPHKTIDKQEMQRLISRNLVISVLSKLFYFTSRIFIPSLVLSYVNLTEYGLWALCFTLISYLNLGALGINSVYIRYVAEYYGRNEIDKISGLLSTGITLVTIISAISLSIFSMVLEPLIENAFKIPDDLHPMAFVLFFGTGCIFAIQAVLSAFLRMLNGLQRMVESMTVAVTSTLVEIIFTVTFLLTGLGIYSLLYATLIKSIFSNIIYIRMAFKALPGLSIGIKNFDRSYIKIFYRFGGILQISGMITILVGSIGQLLTSTLLNMQATAVMGLGARFPGVALAISQSMTAVYLPVTSYLYSQQRFQEMHSIYLQGSRVIGLSTGFMLGFMSAFAPLLIVVWLGTKPEYHVAAIVMTTYATSQYFHSLTGPGSSFFKGIDKPANNLIYSTSRLITVAITTTIILGSFGLSIITIVFSLAIATTLSALIYIINNNRRIGVSQRTYLAKAAIPGLVPYFIAYLLFGLLTPWREAAMHDRWYALGLVAISAIIYCFVTGLIIYWGFANQQERNRLHQRIAKVIKYIKRAFIKEK